MKFRQIILFLNRRCPLMCPSCSAASSPNISEELSPEWIKSFSKMVSKFNLSKYIILTGGEPFLSFDSLKMAVSTFTYLDFSIEILTSGIWFYDQPEKLEELNKAGRFNLRISLDGEHEQVVSMDIIEKLINGSLELEIPISFTLREIPGYPQTISYYSQFLEKIIPKKELTSGRKIHIIPHINIDKNHISFQKVE